MTMTIILYRCESGLMSYVNMKNCIQFYQTAEEMSAELLKGHCSELISNHWVSLSFTIFNEGAYLTFKSIF